jgi:hypothetical protein
MARVAIILFLAYSPYFEKGKGGLWDRLAVCPYICLSPRIFVRRLMRSRCLCICVSPSPYIFRFQLLPCRIKKVGNSFFPEFLVLIRLFGRLRGRNLSPGRSKHFFISTSSRTILGPTQPPIKLIPGALSPRVKRSGREADHVPPTSAEVKNTWICTSTPPYAFTA